MKRPLVGLALTFIAGIGAGRLVEMSPGLALGCAAGLFLLGLFWRRLPVLLALVFCVGLLLCREAVTPLSPHHVTRLVPRDQNVGMRGVVTSVPQEWSPGRWNFKLRVTALRRFDRWETAEGWVWVEASGQTLRYGDEIECVAALRAPSRPRNPGAFDRAGWLARQRIAFTATVASDEACVVRARNRGNPLTALSLRLQEHFERGLRMGLEKEPEIAGVLCGMVLGQRAEIAPDTYEAFQQTGVFHVFAVSGLHVGLVTVFVVTALRMAGIPRRWCGLVAIPILVLYVWATGARPGAVRALVMACVWLGGWILERPADLLNTLAAAALVILVWEPLQLFDGGFQMSFVAVGALALWGIPLQERLGRWFSVDPFLASGLIPWWRQWLGQAWKQAAGYLSCSLAAWIGLLPLMAIYFHVFAPVTVLANLVAVPLLGLILPVGMLAMLAYPVCPWLTLTLNNANFFLLHVMVNGVNRLDRLPGSHWFVQTPPEWLVATYYGFGLLLLAQRIPWRWRQWTVTVGAPVAAGVALFVSAPEEIVELTVFDSSDGVAMFVNLPGERDDFLVDGGGGSALVALLRAQGVDRLGSIVLTCKDKTHVAGLNRVVAEMPVGQVVMSDMPARSPVYQQWRAQLNDRQIPVRALHAGAQWNIQRLRLTVLNPPADARSSRADDNSLVLLLEYGPTRLLWMSDAGETIEQRLAANGLDLRCPILIKGSHNKEPSGTTTLLDTVRPEWVIQVANSWPVSRCPDPAVRERVTRRGARYLRTDETGAVTIRLTPRGYWVKTEL